MPGVGLGVIILDNNKRILLIKRNDNSNLADSDMHLEGMWTLPAGKVNKGETLLKAAIRKVKEEVNLNVSNLELISIADDINSFAHFVTVGFIARKISGSISLKDTLEHTEFGYFKLDELPTNLCEPSKKIINNYINKQIYKGED